MTEQARWVVDTSALISRLLAPRGMAAQAVDRALNSGILLLSDATLQELVQVLWRPKFDAYLSASDRRYFLGLLASVTRKVPITRQFQQCRDPKDDKFLDLAFAGQAKAIITGAPDLLVLQRFHQSVILSPAEFLDWPI